MLNLDSVCKEILSVLKRNGGYVDNHDHKFHKIDEGPWNMFVVKFSRLRRPDEMELCPVFVCRGCSINPFYMDYNDGQVHLSTGSIGGVVYYGDIEKYNKDHLENECWSKDRLDLVWDPTKVA